MIQLFPPIDPSRYFIPQSRNGLRFKIFPVQMAARSTALNRHELSLRVPARFPQRMLVCSAVPQVTVTAVTLPGRGWEANM